MQYSGEWRITSMTQWDSDYLDMEVPAYIKIEDNGSGEFQFGLVFGQISGRVVKDANKRFNFTWQGNDECDEASGSGWLKLNGKSDLTGHIQLHEGDSSDLVAMRMK